MSEFIKKRIIKDLIDEIGEIDAVSLEIIGHKIIEYRENADLVHHGINKDYRPVGYTVDSFSQDFSIIGEYSVESGYFQDASGNKRELRFEKIEKDINHAVKMAGSQKLSRIYLVCSAEQPPSFRGNFNKTELANEYGELVAFLDARELAKSIFRSVQEHTNAVDFYRYYLPDFCQNLDNYEYFGKVPNRCENFHSEPLFFGAIEGHFNAGNNVCVLHGLSGSGKTQAAIDYVHSVIEEFGNYLWISGQDWPEGVTLTAVKRSRGGMAINVAGVFNSTRTLLIIDDLQRPLEKEVLSELEVGFALGGRLLVTSQLSDLGSDLHLPAPNISMSVAFKILGEEEENADKQVLQFLETCRFSPLILSVTREIAVQDDVDRNDLYHEVCNLPQHAHEADGTPIIKRLLGHLSAPDYDALVAIANSGCTNFDIKFLSFFIGIQRRVSLQRLCLLNRTAIFSTLSVHDLICKAVRTEDASCSDLAKAIEQYVGNKKGEMLPSVLRQIHLSSEQLLQEHGNRGSRKADWLTYSLLQLEWVAREALMADLYNYELKPEMRLDEVLTIIDSKEAYSYNLPEGERAKFYEKCAAEYQRLAEETTCEDLRAALIHHQGKSLRRSNKFNESLECFKTLLEDDVPWQATLGQIAHLGMQRGVDEEIQKEGEQALKSLIQAIEEDPTSVPLRVSLASLSKVRSYRNVSQEVCRNEALAKQFSEIVALSALEGFHQFYEGFLSLTSLFNYQFGEVCLDVVETFPDVLAIFPNSVAKRQWGNVCEALINVAYTASQLEKAPLVLKLHETAEAFAKRILDETSSSYEIRIVTKTLLATGDLNGALAAADRIADKDKDHWLLYQKAKVQMALSAFDEGVVIAKQALSLALKDTRAADRISPYYEIVSRYLDEGGQYPKAIEYLDLAISSTQNSKYKNRLRVQLKELEEKLHKIEISAAN